LQKTNALFPERADAELEFRYFWRRNRWTIEKKRQC